MLHKSYKCAQSSGIASTHLRDATDHGITFGLPNRDIHLAPRLQKMSSKHSAFPFELYELLVAESFPQNLPKSLFDSPISQLQPNIFATFRHHAVAEATQATWPRGVTPVTPSLLRGVAALPTAPPAARCDRTSSLEPGASASAQCIAGDR